MSDTLDIWRPDKNVFIRRSVIIGIPTVLLLAGFGFAVGYWQIALVAPVLIAVQSFLFGDTQLWRSIRSERWELTQTTLIHHGTEGSSQLALSDVMDVSTRFGWTVIVTQKNGLSVEMPYVRHPNQIAMRILATRAGLVG